MIRKLLEMINLIKPAKQRLPQANVSGSDCECSGMYCNIELEQNKCWLCGLPLPENAKQTDRLTPVSPQQLIINRPAIPPPR